MFNVPSSCSPHPCYYSPAGVYPARKRSARQGKARQGKARQGDWYEVNGSNETLMLVFRGLAWRRRTPHRAEVAGAVEVAEAKRRPRRLQAPPPPPRNSRRTRPIRCSIRLLSSAVSQFFYHRFTLFPFLSVPLLLFFFSLSLSLSSAVCIISVSTGLWRAASSYRVSVVTGAPTHALPG